MPEKNETSAFLRIAARNIRDLERDNERHTCRQEGFLLARQFLEAGAAAGSRNGGPMAIGAECGIESFSSRLEREAERLEAPPPEPAPPEPPMVELTRYRCHKQVQAGKVRDICVRPGGYKLLVEDLALGCIWVHVSDSWLEKHNPHPGGYFVRYEDGYESYSPAEAFEGGYHLDEPPQNPTDAPQPAESAS